MQQVINTFLYYACTVDSTTLVALSATVAEPPHAKKTMLKISQFLDYVASQDDAILTYWASNTVLAIHMLNILCHMEAATDY